MRRGAAALLLLLAAPAAAQDAPRPALTAELGADLIGVSTAFSGSELLVFGTTDRPIGRGGDGIVVSVVGRAEDLVVRRRVRRLGIWVNGPSARYRDVPHIYAVAATAPLRLLLDEDARFESRLGLDVVTDRLSGPREAAFRDALRALKSGSGEWREDPEPIPVSGGRLFHARLAIPSTVHTGEHRVAVLLVREGRVAARQELTLEVVRVGTAARVADVSRDLPLLYGAVCVALAALAGWLGSVLFRRG